MSAVSERKLMRHLLPVLFAVTCVGLGMSASARPARADQNASPIEWGACPASPTGLSDPGFQCATLAVPLDYRAPAGAKIEIAISRLQTATADKRRGVLLFNPGGPGGPGLDLPLLFAFLLPPAVTAQYDLVGFDPRFIGHSSPLSCGLSDLAASATFPTAMQPGGFDATVAFVRDVASACAAVAGDQLPFVTTANTARDMDQIRQALGEDKISYLGYSYGTYLGAVYASLFPERTDRVVLDSSVGPSLIWRRQFRGFGLGGELRFPDFAAFAVANAATYHLGNTPAEVRALYFQLRDRLERDPIPLGEGFFLDGDLFMQATFGSLYGDPSFPGLAELWQFLASGELNTQPAQATLRAMLGPVLAGAAVFPEVPADNQPSAGTAVVCGDIAWPRAVDQYRRELALDTALFPMFGRVGSNISPCAFWPTTPVEPPVAITANGPANILILENLRDPATPLPGALEMRAALGRRSRLVSVDQGGHGVYPVTPNGCANQAGTAFLAGGVLPARDVFCPAEAPPPSPARARAALAASPQKRAAEELRRRIK
jgi:pimeloyl-ACP methyl ester carboxylesterase